MPWAHSCRVGRTHVVVRQLLGALESAAYWRPPTAVACESQLSHLAISCGRVLVRQGWKLPLWMTWNDVIACVALAPGDAPGCWQAGDADAHPAAQQAAPTFGAQVGAAQASLKMLRTSRTTCSA